MIRYIFLLGILYLFRNKSESHIHTNILHTSILPFCPYIKLHDIVVVSTPHVKNRLYLVDFSPINQSPRGLLSLFLGKNVSAEVRIRHVENITLDQDALIIEKWCDINNNAGKEKSQELSDFIFHNITDESTRAYIENARRQTRSMNMYRYNCKHFSNSIMNYNENA